MLVSVLMASNKIDDYFYAAVSSIQQQTYRDIQVVIVLNGEGVSLAEEVRARYARDQRVEIYATLISGLNHSLNLGLDYCRGELVARMDSDDVSLPNRIATQVKEFESDQSLGVLSSWFEYMDNGGLSLGLKKEPYTDSSIRSALHWRNPICHPSVMFRVGLVRGVGGYIGQRYAEDHNVWVNIMLGYPTFTFRCLTEPLLMYRQSATGLARNAREAYFGVAATQLKYFLLTGRIAWLLGCFSSILKGFIRGRYKKMVK